MFGSSDRRAPALALRPDRRRRSRPALDLRRGRESVTIERGGSPNVGSTDGARRRAGDGDVGLGASAGVGVADSGRGRPVGDVAVGRPRRTWPGSSRVLAGRVEPGYGASWSLNPRSRFGVWEHRKWRPAYSNSVSTFARRRSSWSAFSVGSDGQCFEVRAGVHAAETKEPRRHSEQPALRLQICELRVGVDW